VHPIETSQRPFVMLGRISAQIARDAIASTR
jgi:hypothetical protein